MSSKLIWVPVLATAILTSCGRSDSPAATRIAAEHAQADAIDQASTDKKAAAEVKVTADLKAAAAFKAAADKAAIDTKIAADAKIAADLKAAGASKAAADKAAADTKDAADTKVDADLEAAAETKAAADAAAKLAAEQREATAALLLTQLLQQTKDDKLELADATLAQLDAMKGSLPTSFQQRIELARVALTGKKTAAKLSK